ncbi:hypothetical protein L1049_016313 [Liquidambar formosana]|uniref:Uncharacterized protein n=1 Tax=Liquidambar formosana TaxID=63359 RepID=A0AAP0RZ33_LIQFO
MKSRLSAASARYKESISKSTRGFKEKLIARNNSVKELSKGVQREMNAGIAGVARILERLDLAPKRSGASVSDSNCTVGTSNFSYKGKDVQDNVISQPLNDDKGETAHNLSSNALSCVSNAIPGPMEVSHAQSGH